ncbi:hypothetical protein C0995_005143 [Termitomyces sp. Mi166|nr:hypothetical protein C0995_005143 [Termitomyces sp. Mi166\
MLGIPLLHSDASEESEIGRGSSYSQLATSSGLQQSSRDAHLPPYPRQDTFDFSTLQTGQSTAHQEPQGTVGVYTLPGHGPQVSYTNGVESQWSWHGDHSRPLTPDHLAGQQGFHHRGDGPYMPSLHQHFQPGQGLAHPDAFELHGQHHFQGHLGAHLPSSSVIKPNPPSMEHWLRNNSGIPPSRPLNLWSLEPVEDDGQRPRWTYKVLVSLAIQGSPTGHLSLQEIYCEIENRFQYYRDLPDEPGRDGKKAGKK